MSVDFVTEIAASNPRFRRFTLVLPIHWVFFYCIKSWIAESTVYDLSTVRHLPQTSNGRY